MPTHWSGNGRGGTVKGSQESPVGVLEIWGPSIKIEGGPNISAHEDCLSKQEHFAVVGLQVTISPVMNDQF